MRLRSSKIGEMLEGLKNVDGALDCFEAGIFSAFVKKMIGGVDGKVKVELKDGSTVEETVKNS